MAFSCIDDYIFSQRRHRHWRLLQKSSAVQKISRTSNGMVKPACTTSTTRAGIGQYLHFHSNIYVSMSQGLHLFRYISGSDSSDNWTGAKVSGGGLKGSPPIHRDGKINGYGLQSSLAVQRSVVVLDGADLIVTTHFEDWVKGGGGEICFR